MIRMLEGARALAAEFDDFIVDVWGVVHDGERPFDGVVDALDRLARSGKRVLFVTNTSRAAAEVIASLVHHMGIDRALFQDVVSSGDVTRAALLGRDPRVFASLPEAPRCFHYGSDAYVPWLAEVGLDLVDDLGAADLVVASSAPGNEQGLDAARALLAPAAARGLPLVCTNPDRVIPSASGLRIGPGAVARAYAELGGPVFYYGKPHPPIYAEARRRLGGDASRRVVALGDMLETDIGGARAAGLPCVFVMRTGTHSADVGGAPEMQALFAREGITPDMVLERFVW